MATDTRNWCMNCSDCTAALLKARQQASEQPNEPNPEFSCNSEAGPPKRPIASQCQEPLAWSISPTEVNDQSASMFYTLIPQEIRDMIFTYALTDTTSYPVDRGPAGLQGSTTFRDRYSVQESRGVAFYPSDIAFNLLFTCKAVYLETYALPLRINSLTITGLQPQVKMDRFHSWQLAQIARLDITLPQFNLENGAIRNALKEWRALARNQECYVVPQEALLLYRVDSNLDDCPKFFGNVLIPAGTTEIIDKRPKLLTDVLHSAHISKFAAEPCSSHLRVSLASRLTHLTLRLTSRDWWTWTDSPTSTSPNKMLRLDPTFGDPQHSPGSPDEMHFLARERREGRPPILSAECWGTHISSLLPDLQVLELVLETFGVKMNQLDSVAECAKTWSFNVGESTLVWDGEIVEKRWQRGLSGLRLPKNAAWFYRCRDHEVRLVRFVRQKK